MAWEEYEDLRKRASGGDAPFVLYSLDGKSSRHINEDKLYKMGINFVYKSNELMMAIKGEVEKYERENNVKLLVSDDTIRRLATNNVEDYFYEQSQNKSFTCEINPNFTCGDFMSFYFYRDKITPELFVKFFNEASKKVDNHYEYHFAKQEYETNKYTEGNKLYWVGYAQQYLNENKKARLFDVGFEPEKYLELNEGEPEK